MKSHQKVRAWAGKVTFPIGDYKEDVQPDIFQKLRRWSLTYPYPRNDLIDDRKKPRVFRALFLENEYLKVTVLPELGGHLYSAYDKLNGREVFYRVSELNPRPLGRRGAWGPVGVEFNFPSAHSPTTLSPVDGALKRNPDGGASIVIGDIDRVTRMEYSIDVTLRPGVNAIEAVVTLHNRTALPQSYYYWANAAIPAGDGTRYVIPLKSTSGHGLPQGGDSWPVRNGVDLSWHRNIKTTMGVFGHGCREDFFGAYDVERDWGVVHVADYRVLPGKKMFDWGTGPGGLRKASMFSPRDGAYAELQAGLFEHQPSYECLEPFSVVRFSEVWIPLHGMKGVFTRANGDAAVALEVEDGKEIRVAVNVTRARPRCRIVLECHGRKILSVVRDLSPESPFVKRVPCPTPRLDAAGLRLSVTSASGGPLILHPVDDVGAAGEVPAGWLDEKTHPDEGRGNKGGNGSVENLYLRGLRFEKMGLWFEARKLWTEALEGDEGFAAARLALGMLALRSGRWHEAEEHFTRALARDPNLVQGQYCLGLAYAGMGRDALARDAFWVALRGQADEVRCRMQLGLVAMRLDDFREAVGHFSRVLVLSPHETRAAGMLSASLRALGRPDEALHRMVPLLHEFPTNPLLHWERVLLAKALHRGRSASRSEETFRRLVDGNVQTPIELATDYAAAGLFADALDVLRHGIAETSSRTYTYPMLCYYAGYYAEKSGRSGEALRWYRRGGRMKPDLCFPGRVEAVAVLERVLEVFPDDGKAALYLGYLLYHRAMHPDALRLWRRAHRLVKDSMLLYTTLALATWEAGDLGQTARWLRRARKLEPENIRLLLWLDRVMAEAREDRPRVRLLEDAYRRYPENDGIREHLAGLWLDCRRPEKALEVTSSHRFRMRHGIFTLTQLHVNAHTQLGERLMEAKDYRGALEHFEQARRTPVDLGEDDARFQIFGRVHYLSGQCHEKLGDGRAARECYRLCVTERRPWMPELYYWDCLSFRRLGKERQARQALARLRRAVDHIVKAHEGRRAYVHYLRSLHSLALGRRHEARKEARLAHDNGWRLSQELQFQYGFGFS